VLALRQSSIAKRLLWISPGIEKSRHAERQSEFGSSGLEKRKSKAAGESPASTRSRDAVGYFQLGSQDCEE
jgi:hypothetical protein